MCPLMSRAVGSVRQTSTGREHPWLLHVWDEYDGNTSDQLYRVSYRLCQIECLKMRASV